MSIEQTLPRRCYVDKLTPMEMAIHEVVKTIDAGPAHPLLTDAVTLLAKAKDKVSDFIDEVPRQTDRMTFGQAIEALKAGHRVARAGWNGKGMWLALTPGSMIPADFARSGAVKAQVEAEGVKDVVILPHIDMRAADGNIVIGWLASQTDMLSDDWTVLSEVTASPA